MWLSPARNCWHTNQKCSSLVLVQVFPLNRKMTVISIRQSNHQNINLQQQKEQKLVLSPQILFNLSKKSIFLTSYITMCPKMASFPLYIFNFLYTGPLLSLVSKIVPFSVYNSAIMSHKRLHVWDQKYLWKQKSQRTGCEMLLHSSQVHNKTAKLLSVAQPEVRS